MAQADRNPKTGRFLRRRCYVEDINRVAISEVIGTWPGLVVGVTPALVIPWPPTDVRLPLEWRTQPKGGGQTALFLCPFCGDRRRILCFIVRKSGGVGCRGCLELVYRSQGTDTATRAMDQTDKAAAHLLSDHSKHWGMHWRTYHRHVDRIQAQEAKRNATWRIPAWVLRGMAAG